MSRRPPQLQLDLSASEFHDVADMAVASQNVPHVGMIVFKLEPDHKVDDADVLEKFAWLAALVEAWSSYRNTFYRLREDPAKVMQLSGWDTVEKHYEELHQSPDMRAVLEEFGGVADVRSSWHADLPFKGINLDAPLITVMRVYVYSARTDRFDELLPVWDAKFRDWAGGDIVLGWRFVGAGWDDQDNTINHKSAYHVEDDEEISGQDADDAETRELTVIIPWPTLERWQATQDDPERRKPIREALKTVGRLEVWHLEKIELPKYSEDDDDEDDDEEDD